MIEYGSVLHIKYFHEGLAWLLVRKASEHLQDSLHRIKFDGRREPEASLKDYNADYWQVIPGFPEPATYGAIFTGGAIGLVFWRKRREASALQF